MDITLAGASEEQLLESLDFMLPSQSSYILSRSQNRFYPSGASTFGANGPKVARILLSGDEGWVCSETIKVGLVLTNNSPDTDLILAGSPGTLVSRWRLLIGGVVAEDTSEYGRVHTFFERLRPWNWNINDAVMNNGQLYASDQSNFAWNLDSTIIAPGQSAQLIFTPQLGILKAGKALPVKYAPIQLEITFAEPDAVVLTQAITHPDEHAQVSTTNYTISQLEVYASQILLDSALQNSYANLLLSNRSLQIAFRTCHVQQAINPDNSTSTQISLTRALSRLDAIFVTFTATVGGGGAGIAHPAVSFFHPGSSVPGGGAKAYSHSERNLEFQIQVGSSLFPTSPARSDGEHFMYLLESLDLLGQNLRATSITPQDYIHNNFILGMNLCKSPGVGFSGLNTRSGDLVTIKLKNMRPDLTNIKAYIFMLSTQILEIRESGCSVFD